MASRVRISPGAVHDTLRRHLLAVGYSLVLDLEQSRGTLAVDALTGKQYLDFASFYGSNPLGYGHPKLLEPDIQARLARAATVKVGNPDFYTTYYAEFVETLARTAAPPEFPHFFFVEGGALAVENAMKTAFDWKVRKNLLAGRAAGGSQILHFEQAFHGRAGYTLSVTNTDPIKTLHFPKFDWPRIPTPKLSFPLSRNMTEVLESEHASLSAVQQAFEQRGHEIAAILIEPIQCEGGDNHFRPEFLASLRRIADEREALLIFDEVQTGVGLTGAWWAFQKLGVQPDVLCFAKKMQVGGILVTRRVDEVESVFTVPSRISSTWGGSLVDMVRATRILEIVEEDRLLENITLRGAELRRGLEALALRLPEVDNARGLGGLCAVDLPSAELRNQVVRRCYDEQLIVLACGPRSIRFRPFLNVDSDAVAECLLRFERAVRHVLGAPHTSAA
ncbi:MAG TPA: L-lysine 6-transaminase [Polyangiaceae bacterium]|nr:L-lysine 6-transaminase [Polyangiaceae bacterium]